jgi:tRNA pseudouridine38-40 synthase
MTRYRITIEYDGTPFVGWQIQAEGKSVQGSLATAIAAFCGETVQVRGAGRTDAGVHARGQVAHFDLEREWDPFRITEALNFHLRPSPIAVLTCNSVPDTFDARFSAIRRHYLYRILPRRAPAALERDRVWRVGQPLDCGAMHDAAQLLVGQYDFTTFRAAGCQARSPVKTLDRLAAREHEGEIHITATARSFLHNQVRSMVGSLKAVGEGKWTRGDLAAARDARDRSSCAPVAPAAGLYLMQVDYPDDAL